MTYEPLDHEIQVKTIFVSAHSDDLCMPSIVTISIADETILFDPTAIGVGNFMLCLVIVGSMP